MHPLIALHSAPSRICLPRRLRLLAFLLAALGLGWIAPAAAAGMGSPDRFEALRAQDLRVATVTHRLAIANRPLCRDKLTSQLGFILHSLEQYGPADRGEAARRFGLGSHVSVMTVVKDSAAARAGLAADDQLVSVNGRAFSVGAGLDRSLARGSVERAERLMVEELKKGDVVVRVSDPRGDRDVRFRAELGCPANVELVPGRDVNAWADGDRVVVSTAILKRCRTDDDLALVIAHELAHNLLGHPQRLGAAKSLFLPSQAISAMVRETEEEADALAVTLLRAAAYDLGGLDSFLLGLMAARPATSLTTTHPAPDRRLALLRAETDETGRFPSQR